MMVNQAAMDALLRLSQRRGVVDAERAAAVDDLLSALHVVDAMQDDRDCNPVKLVQAALTLAGADDEMRSDVLRLVSDCDGSADAISHARSLLTMAVRAQPNGRRQRRSEGPASRMMGT